MNYTMSYSTLRNIALATVCVASVALSKKSFGQDSDSPKEPTVIAEADATNQATHQEAPAPKTKASAAESFAKGVIAYKKKDFAQAEQQFRLCLEFEPKNIDILVNLALSVGNLGRHGEALGYWRNALRLKPGHSASRAGIEWSKKKLKNAEPPHKIETWELLRANILSLFSLPQALFLLAITSLTSGWLVLKYFGRRRRAQQIDEPLPELPWLGIISTFVFLCVTALSVAKVIDDTEPRGTITAATVAAKSSAEAEAATLFELNEGVEVIVRRAEGEWLQITHPGAGTGWIPKNTAYQGAL
jgi:tetratricopeptide (TPR) repeat protein